MCPLIYYAHPINIQHPRLLEYFAGIQKFLLVWTLRSLCSKSWQPGVQPKLHGMRKGYKNQKCDPPKFGNGKTWYIHKEAQNNNLDAQNIENVSCSCMKHFFSNFVEESVRK